MPARVSPVERIRAQIDELFASNQDLGCVLEEVARLSVRLVIQAALEAEVSEFLGRDRYERGERVRVGYRNGHQPIEVKTTAGPVVLERPKLRGTDEQFASRLLGKGVSRTNALEALVISGFVRGLSVRDVEAALGEALGPEAALSKSTVNRICQVIKDEFDAWAQRDLADVELDYLFCDAAHFKLHPGAPAEPVLCAWGVTTHGAPVLLGWHQAATRATTPGRDSSVNSSVMGCGRRCWWSPTAHRGCVALWSSPSRARCASAAWSTAPATCSPRSPPTPRPRSRPRSGRSSTTSTPRRETPQSPRPASGRRPSPTATRGATRPRCAA